MLIAQGMFDFKVKMLKILNNFRQLAGRLSSAIRQPVIWLSRLCIWLDVACYCLGGQKFDELLEATKGADD